MYCKYCGTQISDDSIYCSHCGKQLEKNIEFSLSTVTKFFSRKNLESLFSKIKCKLSTRKEGKEPQENKKTNVNPSTTIIRTEEEELYRLRTGVYRLREIPSGYFKCPCCGGLFPIAQHPTITGADTNTTMVGRRVKQKTTSYKVSICSDCYKYKKVESNVLLFTAYGCLTISIIVMCCIDSIDLSAALALSIPVFVGSTILGFIAMLIYQIFVSIFYKKDLSISYHKSATCGAIRPM